jgi:hypothetical protein
MPIAIELAQCHGRVHRNESCPLATQTNELASLEQFASGTLLLVCQPFGNESHLAVLAFGLAMSQFVMPKFTGSCDHQLPWHNGRVRGSTPRYAASPISSSALT